MRKVLNALLCLCALVTGDVFALDRTKTGFFYPTGKASSALSAGHLCKDPCYFAGEYHIGQDIMADYESPIYAIAAGVVKSRSKDGWDLPGVSPTKNCAAAIEHTRQDGSKYVSIYGHLLCSSLKADGSDIDAGIRIGIVGDWGNGDHVHFGIHDGPFQTIAQNGWGRQPVRKYPDGNTFVDPMTFIETQDPSNSVAKSMFDNAHPISGPDTKFYLVGGTYFLKGTTWCHPAERVYGLPFGGYGNSNLLMVGEANKAHACSAIDETNEKMIEIAKGSEGSVRTKQLLDLIKTGLLLSVGNNLPQSIASVAASRLTSFFHQLLAETKASFTPHALAAELSTQQQMAIEWTGQEYQVDGTGQRFVVLTSGPGLNGDKATDTNPYADLAVKGSFDPNIGRNTSGKRPDFAVTNLWTERSSGNKHNTIAWGSTVCFGATVKNKGNADAPRDVRLSFYVSKGERQDPDPRHAGYKMIRAKDLQKGEKKDVVHCVHEDEDDYPSRHPGKFNVGARINSDGAIAESDVKNNFRNEVVFTLLESAHFVITQFAVSGTQGEVIAYVMVTNTGTPFGSEKMNIQYRIAGPQYGSDPIIIGFDQVLRRNLRTGDVHREDIPFMAPTVPGTYTLTAEVDFDGRVTQSNRNQSVATFTFVVP